MFFTSLESSRHGFKLVSTTTHSPFHRWKKEREFDKKLRHTQILRWKILKYLKKIKTYLPRFWDRKSMYAQKNIRTCLDCVNEIIQYHANYKLLYLTSASPPAYFDICCCYKTPKFKCYDTKIFSQNMMNLWYRFYFNIGVL